MDGPKVRDASGNIHVCDAGLGRLQLDFRAKDDRSLSESEFSGEMLFVNNRFDYLSLL